jgi:flagellar biosynthesis protein FlhF
MNIRRFIAANSRAALREVRDVLGGDAVIISNRQTPDGVEILAAAAGELARIADNAKTPTPTRSEPPAPKSAPARRAEPPVPQSVSRAAPSARTTSAAAAPAPEWLTEAQVVRTRKRIATLLENSGEFDSRELDAQALFTPDGPPDVVTNLGSGLPAAPSQTRGQAQNPTRSQAHPASSADSPGAADPDLARRGQPTVVAASRATPAPTVQISVSNPAPSRPVPEAFVDEMRSMRGFIEEQLSNFAWSDNVRRHPGRMKLMQDLLCAGLSPSLARHLQQNLPDDFSHAQGREWASEILQRNLACSSAQDDLTDQGGVYALVGPTGVGKTTTAAKLAARFALKHGVDQLALITTDAYRIGAQDQLRIYGKILGIPVQTIHDQASLSSALQYLGKKKLVLIDTAGLGQRDERVAEQIAMLKGTQAKRLLVLNATVQAETLEEVVTAYAHRDFNGCVLTKIDEAVRLGAVLDVVIRHRLKIQYVANGQRVPEDLHHPNPKYLVHRSLRETPGSKAFHLTPEDHPAWLAAVAQSAREVSAKRTTHV